MTTVSPDELYDFYASLGEAVHAIQKVEGSLHRILSIKLHLQITPHNDLEAAEVLEKYRKKPLGGLLTACRKNSVLSVNLLDNLDKLNTMRRWVIHRLQEDTELKFRSDPKLRKQICSKIEWLSESAYKINSRILRELIAELPHSHFESERYQTALQKNLKDGGFV